MKYSIHDDFKPYAKFKMPFNRVMLPVINKFIRWSQKQKKPTEGVKIKTRIIPGFKNEPIEISIIEPTKCQQNVPCLIVLHGGAFAIGASAHHWNLAYEYALGTSCKVIFVNYRLAPKYPFPYGLEDSYASLLWTYNNADVLGIDISKIALMGDSAGGALAAGVALLARERSGPKICFSMYIYPVTNYGEPTESMKNYTDTPLWNSVLNSKMWSMYLVDKSNELIDYAAPLNTKTLKGLPDVYIEVAEFDCLHDEGVQFANRLEKEGIKVELYESKGTMHGYEIAEKSKITIDSIKRRIMVLNKVFSKHE